MESPYSFKEFSAGQREIYDQAVRAYEAYGETLRQSRPFRGGMHWKKIRGREYLYRYRDRYGHGQSLGPRAPRTEQIFREFARERRELATRRATQRRRLTEQARFCRAAWLPRVPQVAARLLGRLEHHAWGQNLVVIGAQAVAAYEFAAGAFIESSPAADIMADARDRLILATDRELEAAQLMALLRQADRSMAPVDGDDFGAVNRNGYLVQVIKPEGPRSWEKGAALPSPQGAPGPGETGHLPYLIASPKFSQVVIGKDGSPVTMVVPDPRAFALHQLWLSRQADRDGAQRARDRALALAVAELIWRYLPQYHFFSAELRLFPEEIVRRAGKSAESFDFPGDLEIEY